MLVLPACHEQIYPPNGCTLYFDNDILGTKAFRIGRCLCLETDVMGNGIRWAFSKGGDNDLASVRFSGVIETGGFQKSVAG